MGRQTPYLDQALQGHNQISFPVLLTRHIGDRKGRQDIRRPLQHPDAGWRERISMDLNFRCFTEQSASIPSL